VKLSIQTIDHFEFSLHENSTVSIITKRIFMDKKYKCILASQSPRRKELMSWLNIPFEVIVSHAEEESSQTDPSLFAREIAQLKADAVAMRCDKNAFVISSDTIVVLGQKIYGKPRDTDDARKILSELSNQTHEVITAVCFQYYVQDKKVQLHFFDSTKVTFSHIDPVLMENYLLTKDSLDKAGAYGIQGPSLTFIKHLDGSYSNVVGFPLDKIVNELKKIFGENWQKCFV